jgi:hypothetical protein
MKAEKIFPLILGVVLVAIGSLSLIANLILRIDAWRMWPIVVVLAGIGLTTPGFFSLKHQGLGAFFIPGIPVLVTGGILMFASLTNNWGIWATAWTFEVLGLALGFALAALFMRVAGLAMPAIIIGLNGLVLAFCAFTGMWQAWALLWPIEPLAVGLGLFLIGWQAKSAGTNLAGAILCGIAGAGFFISSFISVFNETVLRFVVPGMLILCGLIVVVFSFMNGRKAEDIPVEPVS